MPNNKMHNLLFTATIFLLIACQSETEDPAVDCSVSTLAIQLVSTTDAGCGQADGSLEVAGSGGTAPYAYTLNTGQRSDNGTFEELPATVYTVTLRDRDNCTVSLSASVDNQDGVILTGVITTQSGCGSNEGTITMQADAGTPPYQYFLDSGTPQGNNEFTSLAQGSYAAHVMDNTGCETMQEVRVMSGITWSGDVEAIISSNCALPSCHGGTQAPDFRQFANVKSRASEIRTRTQNGSMPPTGPLSADLVQKIACWVDDGALNN